MQILQRCNSTLVCDSKTHGTKNLLLHINSCPNKKQTDITQYALYRGEGGTLVSRSSSFDFTVFRELLVSCLLEHDLPFSFVEWKGLRRVFQYLYEGVRFVSRNTIKADVMKTFLKERKSLSSLLGQEDGRVCFTTDLWTSINTDGFIALTAHFVDKNWVLQKKILSFALLLTPHTRLAICEKVWALLCEWKLESRILTFTLDNASSNDSFIRQLSDRLSLNNTLLRNGSYLHVRCCAHILNLIVRNGLDQIITAVDSVRESIKYIKGSQTRKQKFLECIRNASIDSRRGLRQDCPTRWNSTFLMLDNARLYKRAFLHLKLTNISRSLSY